MTTGDRKAIHAAGAQVGKFDLLARAGEGGMGAVWKAEDRTLGRTVALKFLPEAMAAAPEARRRFLREARAAGRLSHPAIATVFEAGEIDGQPFIAIQWVDGETVSDLVARGPLEVREALCVARDAAHALAHAHEHGVLHRDVSGRNLMVGRDGHVWIVDFGLALPEGTSRITSKSATLGTMPYLAPEVILGGPSTVQSDVYGLGVILYQMLTGSLPFRGERPEAVLYSAVNEPLEPPSRRRPGIPAEVERLVLEALARNPNERFAGAAALAAAITEIEAGELRRIPAPPATRRAGRAAGRAPRTPAKRTPTPAESAPRYVVVLPFRNVQTGDPDDARRDLLALGISDTVSAQLARYPGILVVSPTAPPASASVDIRDVARAVGADAVLQGSVQRSGERLRITYSLHDPLEGVQVAGDALDGALTEVFLLQDQIARCVADALRPGAASVTALPLRTGLEAVAAQERYLQGIGYLQRFDNEAQVDGAIVIFEGLRDGGDDSALVEAALGRAYLYKHQLTHDRAWQERAEAACTRALELDPRSAEVHLTLGALRRVTGRLADAVRSYHRALSLRPDHPEAMIGLAKALEASGRLEEAEQIYLRGLALRPGFWEPYLQLGAFYYHQGRYERATQLWNKVVELTPDNARAHYNLGAAYFRLERFEEAITAFNRSIAIRPEASAYSNLGTLHYFLGHWSEAAAMFEKAVALRTAVPRLWGNLADAYRWCPGREAAAVEAYDRAIALMRAELELNPKHPESLGWLAEWTARRGNTREATQLVRRALKLAPGDANGMARAVNVFQMAGDRAEALRWVEAAMRAGYGIGEFERDPDLAPLRADVAYARIVESITAAPTGRPSGSPVSGEPGRSTERGACA